MVPWYNSGKSRGLFIFITRFMPAEEQRTLVQCQRQPEYIAAKFCLKSEKGEQTMRRIILYFLALVMICGLAGCGKKDSTSPNVGNTSPNEDMPNNEIVVPEPPEAKSYLPGLFPCKNYSESVEVSGLQANYSLHLEYDGKMFTSVGDYSLTLEYDDATQDWTKLDSGWIDRTYELNKSGFEEYDRWFIRPNSASKGIIITFEDVTEDGCTISWESSDEDLTLNDQSSGSVKCTFDKGALENTETACWVVEGADLVFNEEYYAGKYRTWDFTIQVLEDKVFVTTDGPFTNNQGLAYVNWVND